MYFSNLIFNTDITFCVTFFTHRVRNVLPETYLVPGTVAFLTEVAFFIVVCIAIDFIDVISSFLMFSEMLCCFIAYFDCWRCNLKFKSLQKADSFVVSCFEKYKTQPVSKFSKWSKLIWSFVIAKFLRNLSKIWANRF